MLFLPFYFHRGPVVFGLVMTSRIFLRMLFGTEDYFIRCRLSMSIIIYIHPSCVLCGVEPEIAVVRVAVAEFAVLFPAPDRLFSIGVERQQTYNTETSIGFPVGADDPDFIPVCGHYPSRWIFEVFF